MKTRSSGPGVRWIVESRRKGSRDRWQQYEVRTFDTQSKAEHDMAWWVNWHAHDDRSRVFRVAKYVREKS